MIVVQVIIFNFMEKNTNTFTPAFYVDATNATCTEDVIKAFKTAKEAANIACDNCDWLADANIIIILPEDKKPWYKRFWNWITRKK